MQTGRGPAIWEVLGSAAVEGKMPVTDVEWVARRLVGRGAVELAAVDSQPTV